MKAMGAILSSTSVPTVDVKQLRDDLAVLSAQLESSQSARVEKITANYAEKENLLCCYFWGAGIEQLSLAALKTFESVSSQQASFSGRRVSAIRLKAQNAIAGAAFGRDAPFHYVVHTDVEAGADDELNDWYNTEHMPGLASVPGAVFARRLLNLDAGPRYYACYDLCAENVLGSPEWLAVRGTAWSSRVRPLFRNTRRLMFKRIFELLNNPGKA